MNPGLRGLPAQPAAPLAQGRRQRLRPAVLCFMGFLCVHPGLPRAGHGCGRGWAKGALEAAGTGWDTRTPRQHLHTGPAQRLPSSPLLSAPAPAKSSAVHKGHGCHLCDMRRLRVREHPGRSPAASGRAGCPVGRPVTEPGCSPHGPHPALPTSLSSKLLQCSAPCHLLDLGSHHPLDTPTLHARAPPFPAMG